MMGGNGSADQGAGTPPSGGRADVLARVERVMREGLGAPEMARTCADLRDLVLSLAEDGQMPLREARRVSHALDEALSRAVEQSQEPARALTALDRAATEGLDTLPQLALEGSAAADTAVLLLTSERGLEPRSFAGVDAATAERLGGEGTVSAEAVARREAVHLRTAVRHPLSLAEGLEGTRALFATPILRGDEVLGVLRVGSRAAYAFTPHDVSLFNALAARAATLLIADSAVATQEARARHAVRTFEALIEAAPLAITAVDLAGRVRIWNRAAEELFGWKREEVLGQQTPIVPQDQREETEAMLAELKSGAVLRERTIQRRRKDGTVVDLQLAAAPLHDTRGGINGFIAILLDVSHRRQSEAAAQRTARFREHLLAVVGHDLRNPLTAIVTSAQLLLKYSALDDRQRRVVERIASSGDRMSTMIEELLDFTRTRLGGGFPISPRRVDLRELCEQCIEELSLAHPKRRIQFEASGDLWGSWDPGRMAQVISNLVGNALQHGGDSPVSVKLHDAGRSVVFETHNEGPPIPPGMLPHVFEPGRRGEGVHTRGLGLGLYIAQQIVLAHGGTIEVRSDATSGTTFVVDLPRRAPTRG